MERTYVFNSDGNSGGARYDINAMLPGLMSRGIDPYGEQQQYLSGEIGQRMFPVARRFLCEHCRSKLYENRH